MLREDLYGERTDLTDKEFKVITKYISKFNPVSYCEVGVYFGGNFVKLGKYLEEAGIEATMYGIDLFEDLEHEDPATNTHDLYNKWSMLNVAYIDELKDTLKEVICSSIPTMLLKGNSSDVLNSLSNSFDVIFIDGNHTFKQSMADAEAAIKQLRPGGYLIFHNSSKDIPPDDQYVARDGGPAAVVDALIHREGIHFVEQVERCAVIKVD
jgi:cephalosporin hydroxylase